MTFCHTATKEEAENLCPIMTRHIFPHTCMIVYDVQTSVSLSETFLNEHLHCTSILSRHQ
jgi:hypothetical protein